MIVSVLVLCQTGPSEVIGRGNQQLTVYEMEDIDFGLLASVPRHQGPPFSLSLRAAAASRLREGSTLTCRETLSLSANQGIDNTLEDYDRRRQDDLERHVHPRGSSKLRDQR